MGARKTRFGRYGWTALLVGVVVTLVVALVSCGSDDGGSGESGAASTAGPGTARDFSEPRPFAVGVVESALDDGQPVLVFYPADPAAVPADAVGFSYTPEQMSASSTAVWPLAWEQEVPDAWSEVPASEEGPFPLVVFFHGWGSTRFTSSLHTAHLASWGFVVAVPQHEGRDAIIRGDQDTLPPNDAATVGATIDRLTQEAADGSGILAGRIATDEIAVEGHSAGGRDAVLSAASIPEVDAFVTDAGTPPVGDDAVAAGERFALDDGLDLADELAATTPPSQPSLTLVAEDDVAVDPAYSRTVFDWLAAPKRLAVLANTGHVVFFDGCAAFQQGALDGLVEVFGLDPASPTVELSNNGCGPDQTPAGAVGDVWNHLTVAQLDEVFGIDPEVATASLERDYLDETFPGAILDYQVDE